MIRLNALGEILKVIEITLARRNVNDWNFNVIQCKQEISSSVLWTSSLGYFVQHFYFRSTVPIA